MRELFNSIFFWLKNAVLYPRSVVLYWKALRRETRSKDDLTYFNWVKRLEIINYAYNTIPFYKSYYDSCNFHPIQLKSELDWEKVPILEKQHIRDHKDDILLPQVKRNRLISVTTGGSTGIPLKTFRDKDFPEAVVKWRMLKRWNVSPSSDILMLWRVPEKAKSRYSDFMNALIWWPTRRYKFDVSNLDDTKLSEIYKLIECKKPKIIWGYVGAVEQLAIYMEKMKYKLYYSPLVWVTAAPLTDIQRQLFIRVLSPKILDQYACSEMHWVASSTPNNKNLYVDDDFRHLDIVNDNGEINTSGIEGDILLTDLENKSFPLIKYRVGDRSKKLISEQKGLPFSLISPVKGRTTELIKFPNGIVLSGEYLTTIFDDYVEYVKQFQVVQKQSYELIITVVPYDKDNIGFHEILEIVRLTLSRKIQSVVNVKIEVVDEISSDRGKIRFIRSEVM